MDSTEALRQEFGRDEIRFHLGAIQVYWHKDANGFWCPADGGPVVGGVAKRRVYAFAKQVQDSRDRLPDGIRECDVQVGQMTSDGNFEALAIHKFEKKETEDDTLETR